MYTLQAWPLWLLGSAGMSEPSHRTSARPGPPATIHGNTATIEGAALTCTGALHFVQPLAALATLTQAWRSEGVSLRPTHATNRLRPESIALTTKFAVSP